MTTHTTESLPRHLTSATPPMTRDMLRLKRVPRDVVARFVDGPEVPSLVWIADPRRAMGWERTPARQRLGILAAAIRREAERQAARQQAQAPTPSATPAPSRGTESPSVRPGSGPLPSPSTVPTSSTSATTAARAPLPVVRGGLYFACACGGFTLSRSSRPRVIGGCNGRPHLHHGGEIPDREPATDD